MTAEQLLRWSRPTGTSPATRCSAIVNTRAGERRCGNRVAEPSDRCWRHKQ